MELLRVIPKESNEPVNHVCYHPVQVKYLMQGESQKPICYAVPYEYNSILHEICDLLGWQGGTISQVREEILRLKANHK